MFKELIFKTSSYKINALCKYITKLGLKLRTCKNSEFRRYLFIRKYFNIINVAY